jgi:hypothetical protein
VRHLYVPTKPYAESPAETVEHQARRILRDTEIALADAIETIHLLYHDIPANREYAQAIVTELGTEHEEPLVARLDRLLTMAEAPVR